MVEPSTTLPTALKSICPFSSRRAGACYRRPGGGDHRSPHPHRNRRRTSGDSAAQFRPSMTHRRPAGEAPATAALFDMKADDGGLGYISGLALAIQAEASAADPALNAAIQLLNGGEGVYRGGCPASRTTLCPAATCLWPSTPTRATGGTAAIPAGSARPMKRPPICGGRVPGVGGPGL